MQIEAALDVGLRQVWRTRHGGLFKILAITRPGEFVNDINGAYIDTHGEQNGKGGVFTRSGRSANGDDDDLMERVA